MVRKIHQEVLTTNNLYDQLLGTIVKQCPENNMYRVEQARNYLMNIILEYNGTKSNLPSNMVRGVCAEVMLEVILRYYKTIDSNIMVMKNLLLPLKAGGTTQLDFLILTPTNITVIESKSLFGLMDIKDGIIVSSWTDSGGQRNSTTTRPWGQNMLHIMTLKEYLGIDNIFLQNLVFVFGIGKINTCKLEDNHHLMTYGNSINILRDLLGIERPLIPKEQMSAIIKKLSKTIPTSKQEAIHIAHLKKKYG